MKKKITLFVSLFLFCSISNAQLIFNEVLYDPASGIDGDANGDGTRDASDDEFIEFYNNSSGAIDLSGFLLFDNEGLSSQIPRHIFPDGTIIPPNSALILFGGGVPSGIFGNSIVQTASSGELNLNNGADTISLYNSSDVLVVSFDISLYSSNPDESYTRSPDVSGDFTQISYVNSTALFSPGVTYDGNDFSSDILSSSLSFNEVLYDPADDLDGDANGDGTRDAIDDEFIELVNSNELESINISGYSIFDRTGLSNDEPRHVFPKGTILNAGEAIVVFGGGNPTGEFGGSIVQNASSGQLNLTNSNDFIAIKNTENIILLSFSVEALSDNPNESYTRNPDVSGSFEQHSDVVPGILFSPGTKIDGSSFGNTTSIKSLNKLNEISFYPNPTVDVLNVKSTSKIVSIQLYDITGNELNITLSVRSNIISVSELAKGVYFLKVNFDNEFQLLRFNKI